jgi:hypothetical protein
MPTGGRPLNLRRERQALVRLFAEIGGLGRAVDVRVLQYGVTRQRLRDVLEEGEGWDLIHVSGHGAAGELVLETEDGSPDSVAAAELVDLLDLARERVKLVTVSACWSAALTLAEQRRLLKLPPRDESRAEQAEPGLAGEPRRAGGLEPGRADGLDAAGGLAAELVDQLCCGVLGFRDRVGREAVRPAGRQGADAAPGAGHRTEGPAGHRGPADGGVPSAVGGDPGAVRSTDGGAAAGGAAAQQPDLI